MNLSLRAQLALWIGLMTLVIMSSTTFLAQQVTVWNIEQSIDDALQKRANMVAALISSDITTDEASYVQVMDELAKQEFPFSPLLLRIVNPRGKVIVEYGKVADQLVHKLDDQLRFPEVIDGHLDDITLDGGEPLRVYTLAVSDPRTRQILALVQAVESLGQVNQAKNRLWLNGIIVGAVGGLLAITSGLTIFRRGFRPLKTILQAIDQVDYYHLKARLREEARPAELQQLSKSLTAMWQRLDAAAITKQKVLGSVSHELRTPLTALQGHLEVFLLKPSLSPEVRDGLERMLKETRRLVRMVKDLLLNVQLESNPVFVSEEVNLRGLFDEVFGDMWVLAKGLDFNLTALEDVIVCGDRDLLKQMMLNIVDNAIKFTPQGGRIELRLDRHNGSAVLEVSDTGSGIPREEIPHVTEAFYKSDISRKSAGEGSRLGLSIVKQIVGLHGGQLDIQSRERAGTVVKVRLPLRNPCATG
ncbi:MAG: hypothetical protein HYX87_02835 [Chloroflexi bacterium]|nr:hypothetical protein [Chloroflexota bacterium]